MAVLINDRNELLNSAPSRVTGASVSLSSGTATSLVIAKGQTLPSPGSATLTANVTGYISPAFSWGVRTREIDNFIPLTETTNPLTVVFDNNFVNNLFPAASILQFKVTVTETDSNIGVNQSEDIVSIPILREGADGASAISSALVTLYQRTLTNVAPEVVAPSNTAYYYSTGQAFNPPTYWSNRIPDNVDGPYLWSIQVFVASSYATYASIPVGDWSDPVLVLQDGINGTNGLRTAVLDMYKWAVSVPTTFPSGTSTYTWSTGQFTAPATLNGWALTPGTPVPGSTLWSTRSVYSDSDSTATSEVTWSASTARAIGSSGSPGTSPLIYDLVTSAPVITKAAPDAATSGVHSSVTIQGKKYDGSTTSNYGWVTVTANGATETTTATDTSTAVVTLSPTTTDAKTSYTIKLYNQATVSGATLLDTQVLNVLFKGASGTNGANAISAILSNEAHVLPASTTGAVSSYVGSGTQIRVYEGATELMYDGVGTANSSWKVTTGTPVNIAAGTISDSGAYATVGDHSSVADATDTSSITYTITGKNSLGTTFTITKNQTFSKAKTGTNGQRVGTLELYKWSTTAPTTFPSGTSTYTWSTGQFTAPATLNGWSLTTGSSVTGQTLWAISVTVSDNLTTATSVTTWNSTTVYAIGAAGTNGINGLNNALVYAYKRAATAPTDTPGAVDYSFSSNAITTTTLANSWLKAIPAGPDPLYVVIASASSNLATDSILATEWSSAVLLVQNGTDGDDGVNGINSATVYLYARNNSVTTAPTFTTTGTAIYTFATAALSGTVPPGWTQALPDISNGGTLWARQATAASSTATDDILNTSWSDPGIIAQNGTNGTNGVRGSRQLYSNDVEYNSTYVFNGNTAGATSYAVKATTLIASAVAGSVPTTPIEGDTVTFSNGSTYIYTITYNASTLAWNPPGTVLDGSLLVTGSVTAAKINSNGLSIKDTAGNLILSAGATLAASSLSIPGTVSNVPSGWLNSNIKIGGTNLMLNSGKFTNLNDWSSNGSTVTLDSTVKYGGYDTIKLVGLNGVQKNTVMRLMPNTEYTISALVRGSSALPGSEDSHLHIQNWSDEDTVNVHQETQVNWDQDITTSWKIVSKTFKTVASTSATYCRFYFYPLADDFTLNVAYVKLEQGNKYTDWSPAAEDSISSSSASILNSTISVNAVTGAGFRAGNLTWDAAGNRIAGSGVAMTPGGLVGYDAAGNNTFAINSSTGAATFKGTLDVKSASSGARVEITNTAIKVYDGTRLRVQIGNLTV